MSETTLQAAGGRLPVSAHLPSAYGYSRACAITAIAPLLEHQLHFCMGLDGGHDDDQGRHWIWKSARELRDWLASYHGIVTSVPTVSRALEAIVNSGRWVREQLGVMRRAYYYRPAGQLADKCIDQPGEMHSSIVTNPADSTGSDETPHPDRCAVSEPSDPSPQPERPHRERPVKRGDHPDPTLCQNPGAVPYTAPDWAREYVELVYRAQKAQEQPAKPITDESHIEPVAEPLQLDSRPVNDTVEHESVSATVEDSQGAALNALNTAKGRGWQFDVQRGQFRHRVLPMRRTVEEMARLHGVTEWQLLEALGGNRHVRE